MISYCFYKKDQIFLFTTVYQAPNINALNIVLIQ